MISLLKIQFFTLHNVSGVSDTQLCPTPYPAGSGLLWFPYATRNRMQSIIPTPDVWSYEGTCSAG